MSEAAKFVAGSLQALAAMVLLELPHVSVLTKVDLLSPEDKASDSPRTCCCCSPQALKVASACGGCKGRSDGAAPPQGALEKWLMPDARLLGRRLQDATGPAFARLNRAVLQLIDDWSMVSFQPLDYSDEDSMAYVLSQVRRRQQALSCHCRKLSAAALSCRVQRAAGTLATCQKRGCPAWDCHLTGFCWTVQLPLAGQPRG